MKQLFAFFFLFLFLFSFVSAVDLIVVDNGDVLGASSFKDDYSYEDYLEQFTKAGKTYVYGRTYDQSTGENLVGVSITVYCYHEDQVYSKNTTSSKNGDYLIDFNRATGEECFEGDKIFVTAHIDDKFGTFEGEVKGNFISKVHLKTWADVPLVPEFGTIIGLLTLVSAVGIFFVVRRD